MPAMKTVMAPVCTGHFFSHFYNTAIPILFPLLHAEFGIGFAALGLIVTVFNLSTGAAQLPIGFLIDRLGAVTLLMIGLVVEAGAIFFMGLAPSYAVLLGLAMVAGIGHAVFHPADYSIMSATVPETWLGRAFSLHTFSGHLGNAAAPALLGLLLLAVDWRRALMICGLAGLALLPWLFLSRHRLEDEGMQRRKGARKSDDDGEYAGGAMGFLISPPMLLMFVFFIATSFISGGVRSFSVTALGIVQGVTTAEAAGVLSSYLFASAAGVLAGGVIADRVKRHDRVAIIAFLVSGVLMVALGALPLPLMVIAGLYTVVGFAQGVIRPARDMLTRAATPPGGMGKAVGFVTTGLSIGGALAPVVFGWLVDRGQPEWVFYGIALFMILGVVSVSFSHRVRIGREKVS